MTKTLALTAALLLAASPLAFAQSSSSSSSPPPTSAISQGSPSSSSEATCSETSSASAIRSCLEKQGYSQIKDLHQGNGGEWTGQAIHRGQEIHLEITKEGQVRPRPMASGGSGGGK